MAEEKKPKGKPFQKGDDSRRNMNGRPRGFDRMRAEAQDIAEAIVRGDDGKKEQYLRVLLKRIAKRWPDKFLEIAYGKVPQAVELERGWTADVAAAFAEIAAAIREKDG